LFFNETKQAAKNFIVWKKKEEKFEVFESILLVIFFSSVKSVYLNQFFCLLCIQAVTDVGPNHILKIYTI